MATSHLNETLKEDDWVVLKTNQSATLRVGGYKKETEAIQIVDFKEIHFPDEGCKIQEIYTDDFWVFILLDNGGVISSGEVDIRSSSETKLGVQFEKISDFDKGFFESGYLFKLETADTDWSVKRK